MKRATALSLGKTMAKIIVGILVLAAAGAGVLAGAWGVRDYQNAICTFSRADVLAESRIGQQATQRLQELVQQVRNELTNANRSFNEEVQAFEQDFALLNEDERQSRRQALQQRQQALRQQEQVFEARLNYTQSTVSQRINAQIDPLVKADSAARGCTLLLDRRVVLSDNEDGDLTAAVTSALDRGANQINFDLLALPEVAADEDADAAAAEQ